MHKIERNSDIDKTKGLLILLVVFGHFLENYMGWYGDSSGPILSFIYLIHMPAFIFISGMFFNADKWKDNFYRYFSIFILFQILYVIFEYVLFGGDIFKWLSTPYWIMWFMFTLSAYCLITPVLIKHKMALLISVGLSLYIGLVGTDNYPFSIGRTLSFLPFFIMGVLYGKKVWNVLNTKNYVGTYSLIFIGILAAGTYFVDVKPAWLFGVANIDQYYGSVFFEIKVKLILLIASSLAIMSVIKLSSVLPEFFAVFGKNSLSIYLFHGFVVILISRHVAVSQPDIQMILLLLAVSFAVCMVLKESLFSTVINQVSNRISSIMRK